MRFPGLVLLLAGGAVGYGGAAIASAAAGAGDRVLSYGLVAAICTAGLIARVARRRHPDRAPTMGGQAARVVFFLALAGAGAVIAATGIGGLARGEVNDRTEIQAFTGVLAAVGGVVVAGGLAWYTRRLSPPADEEASDSHHQRPRARGGRAGHQGRRSGR